MHHRPLLLLAVLLLSIAPTLRAADYSDPRKTVQSLSDAIKTGDPKAIRDAMVMADERQSRLLDSLAAAIAAQHNMEAAASAKFGPAAKELVDEGASLEGQINTVLKHIATVNVITAGDTATLTLKGPTTAPSTAPSSAPATAPAISEQDNQPDPLHFRKTADGWKIDAARMMDLDSPDRAKEAEELTPKLAKVWGEIAASINAGKYATVDAAREALADKIAAALNGQ